MPEHLDFQQAYTPHATERWKTTLSRPQTSSQSESYYSAFRLCTGYLPVENQDVQASILLSVSKKRFKRAVKRNRVKRQLREAYRMHKHQLLQILTDKQQQLAIAFIYLSDELTSSAEIEEKMKILLARISEKLV